ncbi:MAG: glycoside hydrolase family 25 protein [Planctomycetota bacterium]|jgi:GH25 family lysozyme M1 (1,4-beta-N-acetylmuramidase)
MPLPIREGKQTGIDTSKWQHNPNFDPVIDYQAVADYGVKYAICRLGVSEHYKDPKFVQDIEGFRGVGIEVAAYHVFDPHPAVGISDQMDNITEAIDGLDISVLRGDFELSWRENSTVQVLRDRVYQYLMGMRDIVEHPIAFVDEQAGVYTASWWWSDPLHDSVLPKDPPAGLDDPLIRANGWSLWNADYGANDGDVPARMAIVPRGWRPGDEGTGKHIGWDIWQFTSKGRVPGIHASVDLNLMRDDVYEKLFEDEPTQPPPTNPPDNGELEERMDAAEARLDAIDNWGVSYPNG